MMMDPTEENKVEGCPMETSETTAAMEEDNSGSLGKEEAQQIENPADKSDRSETMSSCSERLDDLSTDGDRLSIRSHRSSTSTPTKATSSTSSTPTSHRTITPPLSGARSPTTPFGSSGRLSRLPGPYQSGFAGGKLGPPVGSPHSIKDRSARPRGMSTPHQPTNRPLRPGIEWGVGARVEARDFLDQWYLAKMMEIDDEDNTVQIHFEGWNARYNEWMKMDSDRLRPAARHSGRKEKKRTPNERKQRGKNPEHKIGENVFAKWTDCRMYAGTIVGHNPNGSYEVLFYDGFKKTVQPINVRPMSKDVQQEYSQAGLLPDPGKKIRQLLERMQEAERNEKSPDKVESRSSSTEHKHSSAERAQKAEKAEKEKVHPPAAPPTRPPVGSPFQLTKRKRLVIGGGIRVKRAKEDSHREGPRVKRVIHEGGRARHPDARKGDRNRARKRKAQRQRGLEHKVAKSRPKGASKSQASGSGPGVELGLDSSSTLAAPPLHVAPAVSAGSASEPWPTTSVVPPGESNLNTSPGLVESDDDLTLAQLVRKRDSTDDGHSKAVKKPKLSSPEGPASQASPTELDEKTAISTFPAPKAFRIEADHNKYKCPFRNCNKAFRKLNLLESHIKYYHSLDGAPMHPGPLSQKRKKTISVCSTDSEISVGGRSTSSRSAAPLSKRKRESGASISSIPESLGEGAEMDAGPGQDGRDDTKMTTTGTFDDLKDDHVGDESLETQDEEEVVDRLTKDEVVNCICQINEENGLMIQAEIVNCICLINEENGLMIQCEVCLCWQHANCMELTEETLPKKYVCYVCANPPGVRDSARFSYDQDWLRQGTMARFGFVPEDPMASQKAQIMQATHELVADMHGVKRALHSVHKKLHVLDNKSHPEFKFWTKQWDREIEKKKLAHEEQHLRLAKERSRVISSGDAAPVVDIKTEADTETHSDLPVETDQRSAQETVNSQGHSDLSEGHTDIIRQTDTSQVSGGGGDVEKEKSRLGIPSEAEELNNQEQMSADPQGTHQGGGSVINGAAADAETNSKVDDGDDAGATEAECEYEAAKESLRPQETKEDAVASVNNSAPMVAEDGSESSGKPAEGEQSFSTTAATESASSSRQIETQEGALTPEGLDTEVGMTEEVTTGEQEQQQQQQQQQQQEEEDEEEDEEEEELEPDVLCHNNLLEHIVRMQDGLENRLDILEEQVTVLESAEGNGNHSGDVLRDLPRVKKSMHQLLNDLVKIKRMSLFH